jgi:hypothetical protein
MVRVIMIAGGGGSRGSGVLRRHGRGWTRGRQSRDARQTRMRGVVQSGATRGCDSDTTLIEATEAHAAPWAMRAVSVTLGGGSKLVVDTVVVSYARIRCALCCNEDEGVGV